MAVIAKHLPELCASDQIEINANSLLNCTRRAGGKCTRPEGQCPECMREWLEKPQDTQFTFEEFPWRIDCRPADHHARKKPVVTVSSRAVHIAAVVMQRDGMCLYESGTDCKKVYPPDEADCVKCIERWLLGRARRELKKEGRL